MLKRTRPLDSKPCFKFPIDQCQTVIHELRSFPADMWGRIDLAWLSVGLGLSVDSRVPSFLKTPAAAPRLRTEALFLRTVHRRLNSGKLDQMQRTAEVRARSCNAADRLELPSNLK